jgi:hypothetical protein
MGGPGSGGARSGGNKSNATRAKEAARNDKSQGRLSSFFSGANSSEAPAAAGADGDRDNHSKRRTTGDVPVMAHFEDEDLETKRKEAIKILRKVMNEGGFETEERPVSDDDDDNDDDIDEDDASAGCSTTNSTRKSAAYMPQPGSPLAEYLRQVKDQFSFGSASSDSLRDHATTDGLHWIPPPADPVVSSNPNSPHAWYLSDVWCFFWDPFLQHKMHLRSCACAGCAKGGTLEVKSYNWRPFF